MTCAVVSFNFETTQYSVIVKLWLNSCVAPTLKIIIRDTVFLGLLDTIWQPSLPREEEREVDNLDSER